MYVSLRNQEASDKKRNRARVTESQLDFIHHNGWPQGKVLLYEPVNSMVSFVHTGSAQHTGRVCLRATCYKNMRCKRDGPSTLVSSSQTIGSHDESSVQLWIKTANGRFSLWSPTCLKQVWVFCIFLLPFTFSNRPHIKPLTEHTDQPELPQAPGRCIF